MMGDVRNVRRSVDGYLDTDGWRSQVRRIEWSLTHVLLPGVVEPFFRLVDHRRGVGFPDVSRTRRVLVVRLDEIGDVVLTSGFLRELRRNAPDAEITLIVKPATADLLRQCPYVDDVMTYDCMGVRVLRSVLGPWRALRLAHKHLWRDTFDLAIVPRWDVDHSYGGLLGYLSGARFRVGYSEHVDSEKSLLNCGLNNLFTHVLDDSSLKHEVERNLDLLTFLGGRVRSRHLELWTEDQDERFADEVIGDCGRREHRRLVAIGLGAGSPKRVWPIEEYIRVGTWLSEAECDLLLVGGPDTKGAAEQFVKRVGNRVINSVGRTTLGQTGALLKRCSIFVGNDAGPMHLAAAAGLPVVEISCHPLDGDAGHHNSPVRFGPWGVAHIVVQPIQAVDPCRRACNAVGAHCIRTITGARVQTAIERLLALHGQQSLVAR